MKSLINEITNTIILNLEIEYKFLKFKNNNILFNFIKNELLEKYNEENIIDFREDILKDISINFNKYFNLSFEPNFDFSNILYFDKNEIETLAKIYNHLRETQNLKSAEFKDTSIILYFVKNNEYSFLISDDNSDFISIYEIDDFYSLTTNHQEN